jgi:GTPase
MKFLDEAKVYVKSGDGGQRLRRLPAREVHRVRRPGRRRWRPRRRRRRRGRRRPQHADRLPLPAALQGEARGGSTAWARTDRRARGDDVVLKVPVGTQVLAEDKETLLADLTEVGQRVVLCRAATAASATPTSRPPPTGAAPRRPRLAGRGALDLAAPEADRRCRAGRPAQCRQVDLPRRVSAPAEDRRLPLHHAAPAARRGAPRRARVRARRHPRPDRGRARGRGLGDRFLGHVERCGVLLHLVDGTQDDPAGAYRTVRDELEAYGGGLAEKPEIVGAQQDRRADPAETWSARVALPPSACRQRRCSPSGVSGEGVKPCSPPAGADRAAAPREQGERGSGAPAGQARRRRRAAPIERPRAAAAPAGGQDRLRAAGRRRERRHPPRLARRAGRRRRGAARARHRGAAGLLRRHRGGRRRSACRRTLRLEEKQAAAATGQIRLAARLPGGAGAPRASPPRSCC